MMVKFTTQKQKGFTLLELMVVVFIIGVLAAIALPSYRRMAIKNAEADAQAHMGQIQLQLDRWRATALSYRGFIPNTGKATLSYDEGGINGTIIYVPFGSTSANYRYQIELVDGEVLTTLNPDSSATNILVARSWVMLATPNPNGVAGGQGRVFMQRSTGLKCATLDNNKNEMPIDTKECKKAGLETW